MYDKQQILICQSEKTHLAHFHYRHAQTNTSIQHPHATLPPGPWMSRITYLHVGIPYLLSSNITHEGMLRKI